MVTGTLTPAYGRDYKNKAAVLADFLADKDFMLTGVYGGGYIRRSDIDCPAINVRYARPTKVARLIRSGDTWRIE